MTFLWIIDENSSFLIDISILLFMFSECWVLHSTAEYAASVIARTGLQKLSNDTLAKVAEELFQEFLASGLNIPRPFFMKAHRWYLGSQLMCLC